MFDKKETYLYGTLLELVREQHVAWDKHQHIPDRRAVLKAERAEVAIIQGSFRTLFERELRRP